MQRLLSRSCRARVPRGVRTFHFMSKDHVAAFPGVPSADTEFLRNSALEYLKRFNKQSWFDNPVVTILKGEQLTGGEHVPTVNAQNHTNGDQIMATPDQVAKIINHIKTFTPSVRDNREVVRKIEHIILNEYPGLLIGNQAMDFGKQDGVTEIEESVQANVVEQRLNDRLFEAESAGEVEINRAPAMVGCVSNFTNFLDLFRKSLRNLELGVPIVVLSRSNTGQHMFRWFQLLDRLSQEHGLERGMVTFASCDIEQQRAIMSECSHCPLYFTGSRQVAAAIKELLPKTFSSTGGPNTMVADEMTEEVKDALRMSTLIENSGQCTALRHLVVPTMSSDALTKIFDDTVMTQSAQESLQEQRFSGLFPDQPFSLAGGYTKHPKFPIAHKISSQFPVEIDEHWRNAYVDVTQKDMSDHTNVDELADWLIANQPITLSVNIDDQYTVAKRLFERTAMVVYTVGTPDKPALTCQARPQDGEIFGELPPRKDMLQFTRAPVFVPTSTPSYNSTYTSSHLDQSASHPLPANLKYCESLLSLCTSSQARGYGKLLVNYLTESCGARRGSGARTTLFGLQRPPLNNLTTIIRAGPNTSLDNVILHLLPFYMTNARDAVKVSVDESNTAVKSGLYSRALKVEVHEGPTSDFNLDSCYNVVDCEMDEYMMVGQFVTRLLPAGHIKSTKSNDESFVSEFQHSPKWLSVKYDSA